MITIHPQDGAFKALFKTEPIRHALALAFNWLIIVAAIAVCETWFNPLLYFLSVLVIGARMHALAVLTHDATHYRFLKSKKWNDLITNYVTMYWIFSSIENYRANHLKHHAHLNTEGDPDWVVKLGKAEFTFPKTKREFLRTIASYLLLYKGLMDAIWFLQRFRKLGKEKTDSFITKLPKLLFYATLIGCLTIFGGWKLFLIYWIVPYLSTFFMIQYIRSVAEHFGDLAYDHDHTSSRCIIPTPLERFLIAPHHVGYHLDHHLYPGVPFYNLPKLHAYLMQHEAFSQNAHITYGYATGLLDELSRNG
ncbi:MAG: fatty acid desaturase family protein [Bacteroidota bacterium]